MSDTSKTPPTVYVMAGCNGAGKTTFAKRYLPEFVTCRTFLNADLIAARLDPDNPEAQSVRAGRLFLQQIREQATERNDFAFETTLSGRTHYGMLSDLKSRGYRVCLHFLWLPNPEFAASRVANRVDQGGHDVPVADIHRRYFAGIRNLFGLYHSLLDAWWLYDSPETPPLLLARNDAGHLRVVEPQRFFSIRNQAELPHGR
jgi:predicted ABC-type ATPase